MKKVRRGSVEGGVVIAFLVLVVIGLALCGLSCTVVDPGHRGVQVTNGSVAEQVLPEGLHMVKFWSRVHEVNVQQQTLAGETSCFSQDLQTVKVKYAVMYKIPDAAVVKLYREYKGDAYQTLVDPRLQEALKQVTALHNAEQLVQNRDQIRTDSLLRLKTLVGDMITIVDLSITNVDLSDQLEHAIEQKMVKQQESLAKRFELDKEKQEAEITLVKAKAEAESIQIKAKALAESPNVIDLEIIKKWNGVSPATVVVGGEGKSANVVLPLRPK